MELIGFFSKILWKNNKLLKAQNIASKVKNNLKLEKKLHIEIGNKNLWFRHKKIHR